jgi:hypothetical protein
MIDERIRQHLAKLDTEHNDILAIREIEEYIEQLKSQKSITIGHCVGCGDEVKVSEDGNVAKCTGCFRKCEIVLVCHGK